MTLKRYLAMTAAEFHKNEALPQRLAWMACHFSAYSTGLSNCPQVLPPGSMVIVNDRISIASHDARAIAAQLAELAVRLEAECILLDFQRPENPATEAVVRAVAEAVPCPLGVSESYAKGLTCAVCLPPVPLHVPIERYLAPWEGREVWLELGLDAQQMTVTREGCRIQPGGELGEPRFYDGGLFCQYSIGCFEDRVVFTLQRGREELEGLLQRAESLGVTRAVGLYQELRRLSGIIRTRF